MRKKLLIIVPVGVLVAAGFALFLRTETGALITVMAAGRSRCPLELTMRSQENVRATVASRERIRARSRLVRKEGGLELWDTPQGMFWMLQESSKVFPQVLAEEEQQVYGKGPRQVRRGDIVLDCGADVGAFTRVALKHGAARVIAVEPGPGKEICLRRNFEAEIAAGRVTVVHKGVWNREDTLKLYGDSVVEKHAAEGVEVPLTTIDNLVAELGLARVDYIKMDIEGSEKQALAGARATLAKFRPRLSIAAEHLPDDTVAIPKVIRSLVPEYRLECGACEWSMGSIHPQVLHFY